MKSNLLFSGYYGFDNSGDDAILHAIIAEIKKRNPQLNIRVLSFNPKKTKSVYEVDSVDRFNLRETRKALKSTDILISGGGSLLQDITSTRSLIYYLGIIYMAKFYKKKIYVYANGIGPIDKKLNRILTRHILNKVDLITLRDRDSKKFLEELKVRNKNIEVTADPVYTLDSADKTRIDEILEIEEVPRNKKYLGIAVRQWKNAPQLKEKLSKVLNRFLEETDYQLLFIPLHFPEDVETAEEIEKTLPKNRAHVIKGNYSVRETIGLVGQVDTLLAMRLHSLIYAVIENTPIVGLIYDPKVKSLLDTLEIEEYIDVENFKEEELLSKINHVLVNESYNRQKLQKKKEMLKGLSIKNVDLLFQLLQEVK